MAIESQGTVLEVRVGDSAETGDVEDLVLGQITQVTSTAHDFNRGDVVTFAGIASTVELNGKKGTVIATTTNEYYVNIDSTGWTAHEGAADGTATSLEFDEVGQVTDFDGPGGTSAIIDITHLQSASREKMAGLMDEGQFTFTVNWNLENDTGQQACNNGRRNRTELDWRLTYSDDTVQTWSGYCVGFSSSGSVDDKVSADITIEITGLVTTA